VKWSPGCGAFRARPAAADPNSRLVDGIEAGHGPELDEDIPEMSFYGRLGQIQANGDLAVAEGLRYQVEDLTFAGGQRPR
jgi:hypothetical protein